MAQTDEFSVQLRLPPEIKEGDVIAVKAKIKHPSLTGLQLVETATNSYERFLRNQAAVFVRTVEIYLDDDLINTFEMNSSTSDNPLLEFMVRADKEATIRAVVINNRRETAEATADIAFAR